MNNTEIKIAILAESLMNMFLCSKMKLSLFATLAHLPGSSSFMAGPRSRWMPGPESIRQKNVFRAKHRAEYAEHIKERLNSLGLWVGIFRALSRQRGFHRSGALAEVCGSAMYSAAGTLTKSASAVSHGRTLC